jgi:hypothetical protein
VWVTVSRAVDAGLLVEITDRGLGMPADDVQAANERLALGGEVTSDTAKRMGLFVVGRLARRHGATVRLRTSAAGAGQPGVTASVHLPGTLLELHTGPVDVSSVNAGAVGMEERRPRIAAVPPIEPPADPAPVPVPVPAPMTAGGLPRRSPGASGVAGVPAPPRREAPPPPPPAEPAWPTPEPEDGSIYARLTSEWTAPPAPAPVAEEEQRRTRSGLPIRDRGARMIPDHVDKTDEPADTAAGLRTDPAAIRDVLSRQLTGVRRGRAETDEADRRGGDR